MLPIITNLSQPWPEKATIGSIAVALVAYMTWQNRQLHADARDDRRALLDVATSVRDALGGVNQALDGIHETLERLEARG